MWCVFVIICKVFYPGISFATVADPLVRKGFMCKKTELMGLKMILVFALSSAVVFASISVHLILQFSFESESWIEHEF